MESNDGNDKSYPSMRGEAQIEDLLSKIEKLKITIRQSDFDLSDLESLRKEAERLENVIYEKIVEIQTHPISGDSTIYICNLCGMEFLSKRSINSHIIRHHHLKPDEDYITRRVVK